MLKIKTIKIKIVKPGLCPNQLEDKLQTEIVGIEKEGFELVSFINIDKAEYSSGDEEYTFLVALRKIKSL